MSDISAYKQISTRLTSGLCFPFRKIFISHLIRLAIAFSFCLSWGNFCIRIKCCKYIYILFFCYPSPATLTQKPLLLEHHFLRCSFIGHRPPSGFFGGQAVELTESMATERFAFSWLVTGPLTNLSSSWKVWSIWFESKHGSPFVGILLALITQVFCYQTYVRCIIYMNIWKLISKG